MKLVVATHNAHKIAEISAILSGWDIEGRSSCAEETAPDFAGNALIKARSIWRKGGGWVMADDSGLEVFALGGAPGVRSARYAGEDGNSAKNNALLLKNLEGVTDRRARFVCSIALVSPDGREFSVEGFCSGTIGLAPSGNGGFGYDPLFTPEGYDKTFADLPAGVKNSISHRARALAKVKELLADCLT
ncbi:MAG: RdgB/HAM1 family non-canonical purine NTP pyrophosphatase [Kiritimatiellae bacterium]|nr:RdgB/HAM1 family non-canonical purine NTP pyrophosphatase [Kiritimatiellia bacterium]